jgi:cell wall-active antibiotic response 4TMS protein YvqF
MNGNDVSLARAIRGPVTLITLGVLFALNNFTPYRFHQTWPVLLIVFGLLSLLQRGSQPVPAGPPPPAAPQWNYPAPGSASGTFRQSTYTGTPETPASGGAAKGGFGTSAPPRQNDPGSGGPA